MSIKRKIKRNKAKQFKKDIKVTLGLFDKIPNQCLTCHAPYDKNNKEHVKSWNVVVRERQKQVNLYCPTCWNKAKDMLKQLEGNLNENTNE
tara:strand:- start:502 stop:774 length:273 start_codon:yes stop_codon:yes gene_type:complete